MPRKQVRRRTSTGGRAVVFAGLALLIVAGAFYFSRPKEMAFIELGPQAAPRATGGAMDHNMAAASMVPANAPSDLAIRVDMGGFSPPELKVPAGKELRLKIVNPDDVHHTDGGGWHQIAVPKLGLDYKIPPLTNMIVTLPAAAEGDYEFWCDVCCGGKANPTMHGVLRVRA
jgi:heme/copper-type cytochrome/quinol oxidase subunit 2